MSRHDHSAIGCRDLARQTAVAYFSQLILGLDRSFRTGEMLGILRRFDGETREFRKDMARPAGPKPLLRSFAARSTSSAGSRNPHEIPGSGVSIVVNS